MKFVRFNCPQCTAPLNMDIEGKEIVYCPYCETKLQPIIKNNKEYNINVNHKIEKTVSTRDETKIEKQKARAEIKKQKEQAKLEREKIRAKKAKQRAEAQLEIERIQAEVEIEEAKAEQERQKREREESKHDVFFGILGVILLLMMYLFEIFFFKV